MIETWTEMDMIFYRCGLRGVMTTGRPDGPYGQVYRDLIKPLEDASVAWGTYYPTENVSETRNTPENFAAAMLWLEEE